jgi:tetratricopeptide (TPR) repeat protein
MTTAACPSTEVLHQLLTDDLPDTVVDEVRTHVRSCGPCQAALDRLSDDSGLRQWMPEAPPLPETEEPGLARMRQALILSGDSSQGTAEETERTAPVTFLAAAERPGELGRLGPYPVLEEVGRGGMGIVFRARDESLGRTVALKVLRPERDSSPARARFVHEARAAARLRHDHVVAVYAVADPPAGLPYFTMEDIPGPTLAERLRSAHRLDPRSAAEVAVQVAAGLAAAHAAGLVHRDVKPANILLDPVSGRAKIADFGLARLDAAPSGLTEEGTLAGTPAYMSPEQVRGDPTVDARSDVYSLGVTLYEMLTGEAPFRGTTNAILRQVQNDEPRPPRRLNEAVPRDLETVCLKALAKEPRNRYDTAEEFRADLQRFLDGVPVKARPVGTLGRLARWSRRNPNVARLSAALVLVAAVGLAAVLWQWRRAEAKSVEAVNEAARADDARQEAEANLRSERASLLEACDAVDTFLTFAEEKDLFKQPAGSPVRQKLLAEALRHYQSFVRRAHDDPAIRDKLAAAYYRLGSLSLHCGDRSQAVTSFQQARAGYQDLLHDQPHNNDLRWALSQCCFDLGNACAELNRLPEAVEAFAQASREYDTLARADPSATQPRINRASAEGSLAGLHFRMGRKSEAAASYLRLKSIQEGLVRDAPGDQRYGYQIQLARTLSNLGFVATDAETASSYYEQSRTLREKLHQENPGHELVSAELARTYYHIAGVRAGQKREEEALVLLHRGTELLGPVVRAQPNMLRYQLDLVNILERRGIILMDAGRNAEAIPVFQEMRQISERLVAASPQEIGLRMGLAAAYERLGGLNRDLGRTAEAEASYEKLLPILDRLQRDDPANPNFPKAAALARQQLERLRAGKTPSSTPH